MDEVREYRFTKLWFEEHIPMWNFVLDAAKPKKILEIGSFEGRATCHMIDRCAENAELDIYCIDSWEGSPEHSQGAQESADMTSVEERFRFNTQIAVTEAEHKVNLTILKGRSAEMLVELLGGGHRGTFDIVYVDGSHQAADVLCDAVLGFQLTKVGGWLVFDDYLWFLGLPNDRDLVHMPKMAIDSFLSIFYRKIAVLQKAPLYQIYTQKLSD
jgi:predicted O-methyltransferase YrrM